MPSCCCPESRGIEEDVEESSLARKSDTFSQTRKRTKSRELDALDLPHKIRYHCAPDEPDSRDRFRAFNIATPNKRDLRDKEAFPLFNQRSLGSCTANAIAAAFHFDQHKQENKSQFAPSRLFIYYNEREMEGTTKQDSGAMIRDGIKSVHKLGICPETMWPYDISKFTEKPPQLCYEVAKQNRAEKYERLTQDLSHLKGCLASGFPFVFGFTVLTSFETDEVKKTGIMPMPQREDQAVGGHAVLAVGYDVKDSVFIVRNSWGETWGDGGYFYMPFDYMTNKDLCRDFWVITWVDGAS